MYFLLVILNVILIVIWFDLVWVILIWSRMILMWVGMALGGFDVFGVDVEWDFIIILMLILNVTLFKFTKIWEIFCLVEMCVGST